MTAKSILSEQPDGVGFHYGFAKPDMRRIDVRYEPIRRWAAYVGGDNVGHFDSKGEAEAAAIAWVKAHPRQVDNDD